jgi:hypothetical protein
MFEMSLISHHRSIIPLSNLNRILGIICRDETARHLKKAKHRQQGPRRRLSLSGKGDQTYAQSSERRPAAAPREKSGTLAFVRAPGIFLA